MHTKRSTQREWRERERKRHREWEGGVHREMRDREAVELKNSCASFKNKCGERKFTSSCSSRRGGKSWRSANEEEEEKKKKLAPKLNCEEEEERATDRAGSVRVAEKGGDLENAIAAATQSLVYMKPVLLRSRLSLLPSCPCLSRAARMDQDRSAFLVIKACPAQESALPSPFLPLSVSGS